MNIKVKQHLTEQRNKMGMTTYEEIVDKSIIMGHKVSRATISRITADQNLEGLTLDTILRLCKVLNCKFEDLIEIIYED